MLFLCKDYDFMNGRRRLCRSNQKLKLKIQTQIINLIENEGVDTFLVGEIGGFEEDAYDSVLKVFESYPDIHITHVVSKTSELHNIGIDGSGIIHQRKFSTIGYIRINAPWAINAGALCIVTAILSKIPILLLHTTNIKAELMNSANRPKIKA